MFNGIQPRLYLGRGLGLTNSDQRGGMEMPFITLRQNS